MTGEMFFLTTGNGEDIQLAVFFFTDAAKVVFVAKKLNILLTQVLLKY